MGAAHYEVFKDAADQWRWRLVAGNGETVAQSEAYTQKADAERGVKTAAGAAIEASVSIEIETKA
jgi:uncharacterized protein YegP (UPF0339 family)